MSPFWPPLIVTGFPLTRSRGVPGGSNGQESACSAGDVGSVPGLGRFPGDLVKAIVFPVVMYRCESWIIKKAEHQRIDAFQWWCWRRLLTVPWNARRSNQSILKEINPEYSLERLMLKLKVQYFGHLMQRANSLGKTLMLGKIEGKRKMGATQDEMIR